MDALRRITVLSALLVTLTACGGGGGNGGGDPVGPGNPDPPELSGGQTLPDSLYDIPEIAAFTPIVPAPDYDGITGQASLSRENSFYFIEALYQLLEPSYDVGTSQLYAPRPAILNYPYATVDDANCVDGSMDHALHEPGSQVVQVITLDHCVTENNLEIHGQLVVTVSLDGDGSLERSEAFYRNLTIKLDGEELTYHGQITTSHEGVLTVDFFTIYNGLLEATYHTEGLQIDDEGTTGRIYHSDWGYIDLSTHQSESGGMQLTGGSNSYLNMRLEFESRRHLALSLSSSDIKDQYGSALTTTVPFAEFSDWPYRDNREPEGELDAPEILELDQTATLDASTYSDADHDFLTRQWRWLSRPEGCEGPERQNGPTIEFSGQCRGTHDMELVVEDGFHTITIPFSVTVAGPLPQLADSVLVEPSEKSETLSFNVNLENEAETGPVSYKLTYGPPGIEVDQTGTVSGVPETLFQTQGGSVHIGVEVSNERSVEQEVTVNYSSRDIEILAENRGGFPEDESGSWQDINGDGNREQLVDYSNTFAIIEIRDGSTRYRHLETREFSTFSLQDKGVMDYDDDGNKDIVLVYSDKYLVLSGQDFSLIEERAIQPALSEDRSAVLVPGLNPGIYYESSPEAGEWSYYEFASGERYPRVGPSSHGLRVADLSGDGYHSLVATYVVDLDRKPAVLNVDGTTQRLEAYPSTVADIDGDGTDDIVNLQFNTSVDQATMASYSESTGKLQTTYTLDAPELEGEYSFETRFVNLDNEPGDELVLLVYKSDQIYVLKRSGTVFELVKKIPYPQRGDRTLFSALDSLSQFDESSAILEGSTEAGQLFEFSLLSDPVNHDSGFDAYSEQPDSVRGLQRVSQTPNSTEFLGVRRWFDAEGERRKELTFNTVTSELTWNSQSYPDLPVPYDLREVTTISSADGTEEYLLYSHGPSNYSVVDLSLEQVVATGSAVATAYGAGDLDGDGRAEAYGLSNNSLYRLNSDTYEFEPVDNTLPSRTFERLGPVVATFGGKTPALFVPWAFRSSGSDPRLDIYQYKDGSLQRTSSITLDVGDEDPYFLGYAQQDVNGDGAPELIVWNTDETTSYWVIDSSLSVVAEATTSSPVAGVFNLPTHASNDLIAFEQGRGTGNRRDTRIIQIDIASGQVTTRSSIIPGETQKNGLTCVGDTLEECTKQVVTNLGVFSLK